MFVNIIIVVVAVSLLFGVAFLAVARSLIHLCQPNEVLVISGGAPKGEKPYRIVQGGRAFVVPLFETVERMDLRNMSIDITVKGAYSRGGIPLHVNGVANVKIASTQPTIGNAIERFLGRSREEVARVARETLEGNLRGVLATLTPEEVNQNRVKFAQSLLEEAGADLRKLGIVLDTLKIQHVSDSCGYLDSIGRKQSADLQMRSRVAEAGNRGMSAKRSAENFEDKESRRLDAEIELAKAEAQKQLSDAVTRRAALVAEERAAVDALVAKANAELEVQKARVDQTKLMLQADRIVPAIAERDRMVQLARGEAATIREEGKATASALRRLSTQWSEAGADAREIFIAQKMSGLIRQMVSTVHAAPIKKVTVVNAELAKGGDLGTKATVISEVLKGTTGINLPALLPSST